MLTRTGNKRALCTALWVQNGATDAKKCMAAHEQIRLKLSCDPAIPLLSRDAQKRQVSKRYVNARVHGSFVLRDERWGQPPCLYIGNAKAMCDIHTQGNDIRLCNRRKFGHI